MTTGEMLELSNQLKDIRNGLSCLKDKRLSRMITDMEQAYNIPALKNETFEQNNPYAMQLYRVVAEERSI